jgi:hypothetical protein
MTPNDKRRASVVAGTLHAWKGLFIYLQHLGYRTYAWGKDMLLPVSKRGSDWFGLGLTIIDSLDLFHIMSHEDPECLVAYNQAKDWIVDSLDVTKGEVNLFETTIRVLGGLLSGLHQNQDARILKKAVDLGDRLLVAFQTNSGIPFARCAFSLIFLVSIWQRKRESLLWE